MVHEGIRRCDLCASEILGHGGADICLICRLAMEEDADPGGAGSAERWEEIEGFSLTAVIGRSHIAPDEATAANDESKRPPAYPRRRGRGSRSVPESVVHRFAAGLRSISRRRTRDG